LKLWHILVALLLQAAILLARGTLPVSLFALPAASVALALETKGDFESMASELNRKGAKASAPAAIVGKSGVKHEFAFALVPESGRAKIVVDTELSVKEVDEMKVLKFYVKVFDVSPEKAVLCVCPKLGERAATLAKEYGITVLEDDVPRRLIPKAEKVINEFVGPGGS
jgi:hypothetical protein